MDKQDGKPVKDTERLILEAAVKEFSTKGFNGARTSTIAAKAGVTHAMLHYYFRTKEKLFERIFQEKIGNIINVVLSPMVEANGTIKERIGKGIEAHIDFLVENKDLPIFFITTLNSSPEVFKDAFVNISADVRNRLASLQKELDEAHKKGEIAKVDANTLVVDIASLNVFPFLAYHAIMKVTRYDNFDDFISYRKKENVEIIMKRIS